MNLFVLVEGWRGEGWGGDLIYFNSTGNGGLFIQIDWGLNSESCACMNKLINCCDVTDSWRRRRHTVALARTIPLENSGCRTR